MDQLDFEDVLQPPPESFAQVEGILKKLAEDYSSHIKSKDDRTVKRADGKRRVLQVLFRYIWLRV